MKFEKDVFISYAHMDDKPLDENAKGWVTDFHKLLKTRLEQTIGHEVNVWRDERLAGNEVFAPEIEAQLPLLKVMVSIITPRYVESDWCRRELDCFYRLADQNGGVAVGNKSRIFKIVKTPVDREAIDQLPTELHKIFDEILDYKFYRLEPETGRFRELGPYSWADNRMRQEFMDKLDDVAQDIANLIKKLKNADAADIAKRKIFIAETTYDLQSYRDNLVREFKEAGFAILPDKNLPIVINRFTEEVEACLDNSLVSVHLVSSTSYAAQPEGSDKSIVILQNELAAGKTASRNLPRLIWIPPATENAGTNEKTRLQQKAFVDELKNNTELQKGADILEGPLEEFKQAVFDTIRRIDEEEKQRKEAEEKVKRQSVASPVDAVAASEGPKLVYLICDPRDLDDTRPLEDLVCDSGNEILLPLFDGDQAQLRAAHLENLKICDAVIIYYGAGNYRWASSMKSDLLRLPALGRSHSLLAKAIYLASPPDKDKETFRAADLEIINGLTGFSGELFNGFIQKLQ